MSTSDPTVTTVKTERIDYYRALGEKHRRTRPGLIRSQLAHMDGCRSDGEIAAYRAGAQVRESAEYR